MITVHRRISTAKTTAVAPIALWPRGAPFALARVLLWETAEHAPLLAHYLQRTAHPFVVRGPNSLPSAVRNGSRRGRVFELFTLSLDLSAIIDFLQRAEIRREIDMILDLADLPLLMALRKKCPVDPHHPEREWRGLLRLMPTWRPDHLAPILLPVTPTAAPTRERCRKPSYQASLPPRMDDDDALACFGSQS